VATGLLAGIAAGELLIRVFDVLPRMLPALNVNTYMLSDDPILKYVYRPGSRATDVPFDEDHRDFAINSSGFRDYEFQTEKPPGTKRIVVLGDSTSAGNGIQDVTQVYAKVLERMLNESGDGRYEVYNLAVGGYHTYQEAEMLRVRGLQYHPDLVLVGFCLNDFDYDADGNVALRLGYMLNGQDRGFNAATASAWLLDHSRLAFVLHRVYEVSLFNRELRKRDTVDRGFELFDHIHTDTGIPILVFIIPGFDSPFDQYRYGSIHRRVFAIQAKFPSVDLIDLLDDFGTMHLDARILSKDTVHPNEAGSDAIARALFRRIHGTYLADAIR
jgi:lysophospholipase L1-like esterase